MTYSGKQGFRSKYVGRKSADQTTEYESERADETGNKEIPLAAKRTAKDAAMRYLEYRSHTAFEVSKHLKEKGYSTEEREECMDFLEECHFINDADYCSRYIEYAIEKGRGPQRIRQELSQKGVAGELIQAGMEELYDAGRQRESALRQAGKALGLQLGRMQGTEWNQFHQADGTERNEEESDRPQLSEKELAKAARRLASLGFGTSLIYEVLGELRRFSAET